jgi:hypothetical protein
MQRRVLDNVWCRTCGKATTMVKYSGQVKEGDLVLTGNCATCGEKVARLLESAETAQLDRRERKNMAAQADRHPYLSAWMKEAGSIEIGYTYSGHEHSFLRVIQHTDLIWSSDRTYASLDDALDEMEAAIARWCEEQGIRLGDL